MKSLLIKLIYILSLPLALVWNAKVSAFVSRITSLVYSVIIGYRLQGAKNLRVIVYPLMMSGAKHIIVGDNVEIGRFARIDAITHYSHTKQCFEPVFKIGNNVVIRKFCHIGCINRVEIGDYTSIGARTYITDHTHGTVELSDLEKAPRKRALYSKGPVIIGKCVSIGEGCAIMPGVTIGDHSVIGANAVVTKDVPPYSVAVGNPAKVIRNLLENK